MKFSIQWCQTVGRLSATRITGEIEFVQIISQFGLETVHSVPDLITNNTPNNVINIIAHQLFYFRCK